MLKFKGKEKEYQKKYFKKNSKKWKLYNKKTYQKNKTKLLEAGRKYRKEHPEIYQAYKLKKKYGITIMQYEKMLIEQNGVCAICKLPPIEKRLSVDHDHETGKIRGLLCSPCNVALGYLRDSIENSKNAVLYLKKYK